MVIMKTFLIGVLFFAKTFGHALPTESLMESFLKDNWRVSSSMFFPEDGSSSRGFYLEATNATILSSGEPKKAYYVEGSAAAMGWLHGALSGENGDAKSICTTYVHHIIVNLLAEEWDQEMASKCGDVKEKLTSKAKGGDDDDDGMSCETYENLLTFMEKWLIAGSVHSFEQQRDSFPLNLRIEMKSFVDGAVEKDPSCGCTYDKLIYLNYGIDFLMSNLYTGRLPRIISDRARLETSFPPGVNRERVAEEIAAMPNSAFKIPFFCNAFGVSNKATLHDNGIYMARDFQLPTGLVYQDVAADIIFVPNDGRLAHISSGAPGFIGRMTGMNTHGVTMGIDLLRAAPNNPDEPGLNSILLLRQVMDTATSTRSAVKVVSDAKRGCTWLYPICDGAGDCVVIEAGRQTDEKLDPLSYVNNSEILAALPSAAFYAEHSSDDIYDRGSYVRPMNWKYPAEFLDYNEGLYGVAGVKYDGSDDVWGETGYVFKDFDTENEVTVNYLHNNYFPPQREQYDDLMIISNNAIVPEFRTSMMSYAGNFWEVTAHAAQWRYDELNSQLAAKYGQLTLEDCIEIVCFLSPENTPGYWTNTIDDSNPMSAIVEGTMNVADIGNQRLYTKTGYWEDKWTYLTLSQYV